MGTYPDIDDENFYQELMKYKEFYQNRVRKNPLVVRGDPIDQLMYQERRFFMHPQQEFVRNYISPHTKFDRILQKHSTGSGKSRGALGVAMEFIAYYTANDDAGMYAGGVRPSVFIIGFSKDIFRRELLNDPQFGFVVKEEIEELHKRRRIAEKFPDQMKAYRDYNSKLKKRLTNKDFRSIHRHGTYSRVVGGYFRFIGYKEFFNRFFEGVPEDTTTAKLEAMLNDPKSGVTVNQNLLNSFKDSLIICDEIHNVYNSIQKNNYGLALQVLLDRCPSLRAIFLSATPINNSPTEVVDLLNLLVSKPERVVGHPKVLKSDLFTAGKLNESAPALIRELVKGRVSFLEDTDPQYYPEKSFIGEPIRDCAYLKFRRCPMSDIHAAVYKSAIHTIEDQEEGTSEDKLPLDAQTLLDIVYPVSREVFEGGPKYDADDVTYIYKSDDIKRVLGTSQRAGQVYSGDFLERENLAKYSAKYATMLEDLFALLEKGSGKIMIYHQYVYGSGVVTIADILKRAGILDEHSSPTPNSICSECGKRANAHDATDHAFLPTRYVLIHSNINKHQRITSIEKFNDRSNATGKYFKILIGSKIVQESEDFKAIQHMFVLTLPTNFPTLIQVIGRAVRKHSHKDLPPEQRKVEISIYVSSMPNLNEFSYEEKKYQEKSKTYLTIQTIEREINRASVDTALYPIQFASTEPQLGSLYFEPLYEDMHRLITTAQYITTDDKHLLTFRAYHAESEIHIITFMLKRLFLARHIWSYDELWHNIRAKIFEVPGGDFLEENFIIALGDLTWDGTIEINEDVGMLSRLLQASKQIQDIDGREYVVISREIPDIAKDIHNKNNHIMIFITVPLIHISHIRHQYFGKMYAEYIGRPHIDIDAWYRYPLTLPESGASINNQLYGQVKSFQEQKEAYIAKYAYTTGSKLIMSLNDYPKEFHAQLAQDAIIYVFGAISGIGDVVSEHIMFYYNILYVYTKFQLVIFASHYGDIPEIRELYGKYCEFSEAPITQGNVLISSLTSLRVPMEFEMARFKKYISSTRQKDVARVNAAALPIGHRFTSPPKILVPEAGGMTWRDFNDPARYAAKHTKENDIIVGFYDRSKTFDLKFKLRSPIHRIKVHKDKRLIEKGTVCSTKNKAELRTIARQLGIKYESSIDKMCESIRDELLRREIAERTRYNNTHFEDSKDAVLTRWIYMVDEPAPTNRG